MPENRINFFEEKMQNFDKLFTSQAQKIQEIDIFLRKISQNQLFLDKLNKQIMEFVFFLCFKPKKIGRK